MSETTDNVLLAAYAIGTMVIIAIIIYAFGCVLYFSCEMMTDREEKREENRCNRRRLLAHATLPREAVLFLDNKNPPVYQA